MPDEPIDPPAPDAEPDSPPEGDDEQFDAERAKAKIAKANSEAAGLRKRMKDLEARAAKADEYEQAQKTESEKVAERIAAAEKAATEAERRALLAEVRAQRPELTPTQVARLNGDDIDALIADATELYGDPSEEPASPKRRPSELRPGAVPSADPEPDYDAIANAVRRW
jgi:hypothetical protein